jgi:hypothetical protein
VITVVLLGGAAALALLALAVWADLTAAERTRRHETSPVLCRVRETEEDA